MISEQSLAAIRQLLEEIKAEAKKDLLGEGIGVRQYQFDAGVARLDRADQFDDLEIRKV